MCMKSSLVVTALTTSLAGAWGVFMRVAVAVAMAYLSVVGVSVASDAEAAIRRRTDIAAQELDSALQVLAKDRDRQVIYPYTVVGDKRTDGAHGVLTFDEALTQILSGTHLTFRYLDEKTVTILPTDGSSPASTHSRSAPDIEGGEEGKKNSSDSFRLAQVDQGQNPGSRSVSNASEKSTGSPEGTITLEEVVVTAQKREERLIDTPQSVSVLSTDELAKIGAVQFRDFANTVPGLTFSTFGAGRTQVSLRGVTTGQDVGPTVGIYLDDIPVGSSSAFAQGSYLALDLNLFDTDRIEVLRGPQGTLYGASTMGGLIKYVSKRPDMQGFGGDVQTGVSDTHDGGVSYNVAGAVNAPILTDKVAVRASGFESRDGGYIDNVATRRKDVNRSDIYGGRVEILLTPTDRLTIRIGGLLQDIRRDGDGTVDYPLAGPPVYGSLEQYRPAPEPFDQRFRLVSGTVGYDLGSATLTSISSYQTMRTQVGLDASGLYVPLLQHFFGLSYSAVGIPADLTTNKFTQEVRIASNGTQTLEWLIGGFYTHETSSDNEVFALYDPAGRLAPNSLYTASFLSGYKESAGFGDLTYHLTHKLDISGGIRYARNNQEFTQNGSGVFITSRPTNYSSEGVATYLANARYHFSDDATGYLRYATGYRPGGPNFVLNDPATGLPVAPTTFEADRLKSYEAGFKADTADRRFGIDLDGYYIDWSNIQVVSVRSGVGFRVNAPGGATVRGAELTLTARPTIDLTVMGAFAYQDAHLSQADTALGAAKNERLPNVPHFTAALNADYVLPVDSLHPTVGLTLRTVSDRTASFNNSNSYPQYHLPGYTTVDLRTGVTFSSVNVQLYVHNLADKRGQLSAYTPYGTARAAILQPRTVGITATTHF
jgi:iron complex outermembrane receptor protein